MASITRFKNVDDKGRTYILVAATPQSPETRALLRKFDTGVREFVKRWKAIAAARKKAAKSKTKPAKK
jgi:hypothetical protein